MPPFLIDEDGNVLPITNWLDHEGEECEPDDAVCVVAGKDNHWVAIPLANMEPIRPQ